MKSFLLGSILTASGHAQEPVTVADDPFTDGETFSATGDPLGLVWFQGKRALQVVDGDSAIGDGKALHLPASPGFASFSAHFPAVPLEAEGDTLTVEFDYRLPTGLPGIGAGLRMGVYDSHATLRTTDNPGTSCHDDSGYGVSTNASGSTGARDSQCFREPAGNDILGGPAPAGTTGISGGKSGPAIPADGARHHLRLTLARSAGGGLTITCAADDRELASAAEASENLLTRHFDHFALGFAGTENQGEITLDNFKITALTQQPLASMAARPKAAPSPPAFRTWTNKEGRKIEAIFLAHDAATHTVKIQLRDGREFALPLNALSAEDAAYVLQNAAAPSPSSSQAWTVQYPEPLRKAAAKLESSRTLLRTLRAGHPRLMMLAEDWAPLKELIQTDATAGKLYATTQSVGTAHLTAAPLEHVLPDGVRLLQTSREFIARIYTLGVLHRLDGDPKWSARAIKEMLNICAFKDWNPSHFLDVGEMVHGMAVGYDWFYDQLTESERATVRKAILEKAFIPAAEVYAKPGGWHRSGHLNNWNHVCNGGLVIAALALADEEKKECQQILESALTSLEPAMNLYLPDGAWDEGVGYWDYATNYVISCSEALRTATGSDGGIGSSPALDKAAAFMLHATGASGTAFNFADSGASNWNRPAFFWLGRRFQQPGYSSMVKSQIQRTGPSNGMQWFSAAHGLLWFHRQGGATEWQQEPCDRVFRRIEMVSLRSSWDANAWSIIAKGGDNTFNHGNLDLGTFIMDALGIRWAIDLGADNYGLEGYFGPQRFTHYRTSTAGQNTLTWDNKNQELDGVGLIESFESTPDRGWAILDLSKGYGAAKKVLRGIQLARGSSPSILIQDEITKPGEGALVWTMHTQAAVECTGARAVLSLGGRQLQATLVQPANAAFQVEEVDLQPPANPTENTRKLLVKAPADGKPLTIAIRFSALNDSSPPAPLIPLAEWGGKPVPR